MYFYLVGSLRRRLLAELQKCFSGHPVYRKIVPYIQNKYSFKERPQFGIVIKGSSGNKVQLSGDNFVGTVQSHVMLAYVGQPVFPLEWVREDLLVRDNGMPTAPGVYYLEILRAPMGPNESGLFVIDPLLTVVDEPVLRFQSGVEREAQLQQIPVQGTLCLYENGNYSLTEGTDYTVDYSTGAITFLGSYNSSSNIVADYRYAADSVGPIEFQWNTSNSKILPGVVLAFGKRAEAGDKVAIVVYPDRVDTANAYGGKFEVNFDLDVLARDPNQSEEIADLTVMYIWSHLKNWLELEGIEVIDVSIGGESEELYDETAEEYSYTNSLSVQLRSDWEVHIPLPLTISKLIQQLHQVSSRLFFDTAPILLNKLNDFERLG